MQRKYHWLGWLGGLIALVICACFAYVVTVGKIGDSYDRYSSGSTFPDRDPDVSPDGKTLIFSSPVTGRGDIYAVDVASGKRTLLMSSPQVDLSPTFSTDGQEIVFAREEHTRGLVYHSHLFVMNRDGQNVRRLTQGDGDDYCPSLSPDGKAVLFCRQVRTASANTYKLYLLDRASGNIQQLTQHGVGDAHATFSSTGNSIYFTVSASNRNQEIWSLDLKSGKQAVVCNGWSPAVSKDDKYLICLDQPYGQTLWHYDFATKQRRLIYPAGNASLSAPRILPNDKGIVFWGGNGSINTIHNDGTDEKVICLEKP